MRNVEIKARVQNKDDIIAKAKRLSNSDGLLIKQYDTFYKVIKGRLKIRQFEDGSGESIYYNRPDTEGPKICDYFKLSLTSEDLQGMRKMYVSLHGVTGEVIKSRLLFIVGQTRIHVDNVEGLGDFMELEVVLNDDQSLEDGQQIAEDLMTKLGIAAADLISGSYVDMLQI